MTNKTEEVTHKEGDTVYFADEKRVNSGTVVWVGEPIGGDRLITVEYITTKSVWASTVIAKDLVK